MSKVDDVKKKMGMTPAAIGDSAVDRVKSQGISSESIDSAYIDSFARDMSDLFKSADDTYKNLTWESAKTAADDFRANLTGISDRAAKIRSYTESKKAGIDSDAYGSIMSALDSFDSQSDAYFRAFVDARNYYGQYGSADEYKYDSVFGKGTSESMAYDLDAGRKEQKDLEDLLSRVKKDPALIDGTDFASAKDISKALDELTQTNRKNTEIQNKVSMYYDAMDDADFMEYAVKGSASPDNEIKRLTSGYLTRSYDISKSAHIDKMTDDERRIYDYYLGKYGKGKADEYLNSVAADLAYRVAEDRFDAMRDSDSLKMLFGIQAGLEQNARGVEGLVNAITGSEKMRPASATEYMSSMIRDSYGPVGQGIYDLITTTSNMIPSIAISSLIGGPAGAIAGAAQMGGSAGGNAYREMIELGYRPDQARIYAAEVAASETGMQYLIGGITRLGGVATKNVLSRALEGVNNAFVKFVLNMASEGVEEFTQDIVEPYLKAFATGHVTVIDDTEDYIKGALYSGMLGALSAGVLNGVDLGINNAVNVSQARRLIADGKTEMLKNVGKTYDAATSAYKIANKLSENPSAWEISKLLGALNSELSDATMADIAHQLEERGLTGEDARSISEWLGAAVVNGKNFTTRQQKILENNEVVSDVFANVLLKNSTVNQRLMGYADAVLGYQGESFGTDRLDDETARQDIKGRAEAALGFDAEPVRGTRLDMDSKVSDSGRTQLASSGKDVSIKRLEVEKGKLNAVTEGGIKVDVDDILMDSAEKGFLLEYIRSSGMSTKSANVIYNMSDTASEDMYTFVRGFNEAYRYGKSGYPFESMSESGFNRDITKSERRLAYNAGAEERSARASEQQNNIEKKTGVNKKHNSGKVTYLVSRSGLTDIQKTSLDTVSRIVSDVTGNKVFIYQSEEVNGRRVLSHDIPGTGLLKGMSAPNGFYDRSGDIYLDINAGNDGRGTVLWTMAHELTHFIRDWSPAKYKDLSDFLMENYAKQGTDINSLVAAQQRKAENRGRKLSYDEAYDEVIADSMQMMLTDTDALTKIEQLKAKDRTLFEKIRDAINRLISKIRELYTGIKPDTMEAGLVKEMTDALDKLSDLWSSALVSAGENYSSTDMAGVSLDTETESVNPSDMSLRTWTESEYVTEREETAKEISKSLNVSIEKAYKYIDDINSVARLIADDKARLDYDPNIDPNATVLKPNEDYKYSVDMSTLCAKRLLFTGTFDDIQRMFPNTAFTSEDVVRIRQIMQDKGYQVACGFCYVESTRREIGQITEKFIERYVLSQKTGDPISRINSSGKEIVLTEKGTRKNFYADKNYTPTMANLNTTDIDMVKRDHPDVYKAYLSYMNSLGQSKPKLLETRAEYKGEILKVFKGSTAVNARNKAGGLRLQSFSDFEIVHLIDMMQITMDMARVGLKSQAYTKVPEFAAAFGDTGIKINLSLVAKDSGVDENGNLIFDDVEGMPADIAFELREKFSKTVGTILVGKNNKHIRTAMADPRIDYIIPFHKSSWKEALYDALGISGYEDYTKYQHEKSIDPNRDVKDYDPSEYWDYSKTGDENAKIYLKKCADDGRIPKFPLFSAYSGYWKLLIDFKMYDNDGVGAPQEVVKPIFHDEVTHKLLDEYKGGHRSFPSAKDVVNEFASEYWAANSQYDFSERITDKDLLNRINKEFSKGEYDPVKNPDGGYITTYKSMAMEKNGELHSPMARKINGEFENSYELFSVYKAVEHPELIIFDKDGKPDFKLDKGEDKYGIPLGTLSPRYNPYEHSSNYVINDQFSSAYKRNELVVVECRVPVSESNKSYTAKYAKDSTGWSEWKKGPVGGQLANQGKVRRVFLSRYLMPVRILSDAEVASRYMDTLKGTEGITIPDNTVTPGLLKELKKLNAPIDYNGHKEESKNFWARIDKYYKSWAKDNETEKIENLVLELSKDFGFDYDRFKNDGLVQGTKTQNGDKWKTVVPLSERLSDVINQSENTGNITYSDRSEVELGTLFSGGDTFASALDGLIHTQFAAENRPEIVSVYKMNHGGYVYDDVLEIDPASMPKVQHMHVSPPCVNFSGMNNDRGEKPIDKKLAKKVAEIISTNRPRAITIENVSGYATSDSMNIIRAALKAAGYKSVDIGTYKDSEYGGYTNRERVVLRAMRDEELPAVTGKTKVKRGWGEAVGMDFIKSLPKADSINPRMIESLKENSHIDVAHINKPLLVFGESYANGSFGHAFIDQVCPTIVAKTGASRIFLPDGTVKEATPKLLAKIMGLGDFQLPTQKTTARRVIGNGIPAAITQNVMGPVINMIKADNEQRIANGEDIAYSDRGSGYYGYSMSNNARAAYEDRERPLSKWTKSDIIDAIREIDPAKADMLSKVNLKTLKDTVLTRSSWHHTSNYYNETDFYSLDTESVEALTDKEIKNLATKKETKAAGEEFRGDIEYLEWGGTRAHPHATKKTLSDVNIEKRGSFYIVTDDSGKEILRKKIGSNGTYVTNREEENRRLRKVRLNSTAEAYDIYEDMVKNGHSASWSGNWYRPGRKPSSSDVENGLDKFFKVGEQRLSPNDAGGYDIETWNGTEWSNNSIRFSDRDYENITHRRLLAEALSSATLSPVESKLLERYKKSIDSIYKMQKDLNGKRITLANIERQPDKAKYSDKVKALKKDIADLAKKISTADKKLLNLEVMKPIQDIMTRESVAQAQKDNAKIRQQYGRIKGLEQRLSAAEDAAKGRGNSASLERRLQNEKTNFENYKYRVKETELKQKISSIASDLKKRITHPTDRAYVPAGLVKSIVDAVNEIDAVGAAEGTQADLRFKSGKQALNNIKSEYDKIASLGNYDISSEYDPQFSKMIGDLADVIGDRPLKALTYGELEDVYYIMVDIRNTLRDCVYQINKNDRILNYIAGQQIINNMDDVRLNKLTTGKVADVFRNWTDSPMRAVREMSGYDKDSRLESIFNELNTGVREMNRFAMESNKMFDEVRTSKEYLGRFTDSVEKPYDFGLKDMGGDPLKITKQQAMQVLLTWERERANENRSHLETRWIVIPDVDYLIKGDPAGALEHAQKMPPIQIRDEDGNLVDSDIINTIRDNLDEWDLRYLDVAKKFLREKAPNAVNLITMQTKHRPVAQDNAYVPYEVDRNFVNAESDNILFDGTIDGMGMLKSITPFASQPLIMRGLNAVIDKHIDNVSKVWGLSIPIRNWNKLFNMKQTKSDGGRSVKGVISETWGAAGTNLLDQAVADLQSRRRNDNLPILNTIKSGFVVSTLASNLSVWMKQAASYPTAGSILSHKALTEGLARYASDIKAGNVSNVWAEIDDHTAQHWIRRRGLSHPEIGEINQTKGWVNTVNRKLGKASPMNWIQSMDVATTAALWEACKAEVEADGVKPTDQKYWDTVTELYDKVIENTQPMYDPLHRPEITRNKAASYFVIFQTQPLQNSGILREAAMELRAARKRYGKGSPEVKAADANMRKAITSQLISHALFTVMTLAGRAALHSMNAYRDDDKRLTAESVSSELASQYAKNLFGAIMPVIGNYLVSAFERVFMGSRYDILSDPVVDKVNTSIDTLSKITDPSVEHYREIIFDIMSYMGIPAKNAWNIIYGAFQNSMDVIQGNLAAGEPFEYGVERSDNQNASIMLDALINGDTGTYDRYVLKFDSEAEARKELSYLIKNRYASGEMTREDAERYLIQIGSDAGDVFWDLDKADYKIENGSVDGYSKYKDFDDAVATGRDIKRVIKTYLDNGVSRESLASEITRAFKGQYVAASKTEKARLKGYLLNAYELLGYDRSKKSKDIDKWQ